MKTKTLNSSQLEELKLLIGQGETQLQIAKHFNMTDDTLRRIMKSNGISYQKAHKCQCIICGDIFWSNIKDAKTCSKEHHAVCSICGSDFIVDRFNIKDTCSKQCTNIKKYGSAEHLSSPRIRNKIQNTLHSKYDVDNISQLPDHLEKSKKTCLQKYGAETYQQSDQGRSAIESTCTEKYGAKSNLCAGPFRDAIDQKNIEKYGTKYPSTLPQFAAKQKATLLERYGVENAMQIPEVADKFRVARPLSVLDKMTETIQERYGVPWACMREEARNHTAISKRNLEFKELLESNGIECSLEYHIENRSYDLKINNTLIEIDPTCTHNSYMSIFEGCAPLDVNYHKMKSELAERYGYRCIHIFDWDAKSKIVELIKPCITVFARKCELKHVSRADADAFTLRYHLKGSCNGQDENYGLYYKGELVEIMTFGKPRYNSKYDYELLRLCTKFGVRVTGGASKLFNAFKQNHVHASVISYCDRSKFTGDVYEQIGMQYIRTTDPAKIWSKGDQRITQNLLNQRGYDQLFNTAYGKGTSNEQLMLDHKWLPVYDCGQAVYVSQ